MNYICSKKTTLYWIVSRQHLMCCFKSVATIWHLFNAKIVYDYIIIPKYCVEIPFWLRRTTFSRIFTFHVNLNIYMYVAAVSLVATLTKCRSASPALSLCLCYSSKYLQQIFLACSGVQRSSCQRSSIVQCWRIRSQAEEGSCMLRILSSTMAASHVHLYSGGGAGDTVTEWRRRETVTEGGGDRMQNLHAVKFVWSCSSFTHWWAQRRDAGEKGRERERETERERDREGR